MHNDLFRLMFGDLRGDAKVTCVLKLESIDVTFNVACQLSQPIGKAEFSAPLKIEQTLSMVLENSVLPMGWDRC